MRRDLPMNIHEIDAATSASRNERRKIGKTVGAVGHGRRTKVHLLLE